MIRFTEWQALKDYLLDPDQCITPPTPMSGVAGARPQGAVEAERRQDQAEPCNTAPPTNPLGFDGSGDV